MTSIKITISQILIILKKEVECIIIPLPLLWTSDHLEMFIIYWTYFP